MTQATTLEEKLYNLGQYYLNLEGRIQEIIKHSNAACFEVRDILKEVNKTLKRIERKAQIIPKKKGKKK